MTIIAAAPVTAAPPTPELAVSATVDLDPAGEVVTVSGTGYDVTRGIYVAFCVMPAPGMTPTPCGGGVDLSGASSASQWISSNPPDYGDGLAVPYGPDGSFTVELTVGAMLTADIDCRVVQCAVVTRADHTNLVDRSLDVLVPVFFRAESVATTTTAGPTASTTPPADGSVAVIADPTLTAARGAGSTLPIWVGSGAIVAALFATSPRRRDARRTQGAES